MKFTEESIKKAQTGDRKSINKLYIDIKKYIILYFIKHKVNNIYLDDTNSIVIEKIIRNISQYNFEYAFSTYLNRCIHNYLVDVYRTIKHEIVSLDSMFKINDDDDDGKSFDIPITDTSFELIDKVIVVNAVSDAIQQLPKRYRDVLSDRIYDELTYAEISEKRNITVGTVKANLHRSKKILEGQLKLKSAYNIIK